jgi:hypothetical protein
MTQIILTGKVTTTATGTNGEIVTFGEMPPLKSINHGTVNLGAAASTSLAFTVDAASPTVAEHIYLAGDNKIQMKLTAELAAIDVIILDAVVDGAFVRT